MSVNALAFRSSKLGFRSSKLGIRKVWYQCTNDYNETLYAYAWANGNSGTIQTAWPYTTNQWNFCTNALWGTGTRQSALGIARAQIRLDHSHGSSVLNQWNECQMSYCQSGYVFPEALQGSITGARLRLYNSGCARNTVTPVATPVYRYDGELSSMDPGFFLDFYLWASTSVYYYWSMPLEAVRAANNAMNNGIIAAGMGRDTFMRNGYIDIGVPNGALSLLNSYTGIYLQMSWNWSEVYPGPYCGYCLGDYVYTGYQSSVNACALVATQNLLVQYPELYVS